VYERQSDVLSYIERRERLHAVSATFVFARAIAEAVVEHLNWKARDAVYLASLA
jgi:hypothetical protein